MIILAVDTATPQVSAAIGGPGGVMASFRVTVGRRHAETLAPGIAFLAAASGVRLQEVDLVAVDVGPGLFTGLRVGLATVKALGAGLDLPAMGFSSLDILAFGHRSERRALAAVVDARRSEVFWALYRPDPDPRKAPEALTEPAVSDPRDVAKALASLGDRVLAVGDGASRYAETLAGAGVEIARPEFAYPSAETLLEIAAIADTAAACRPEQLRPLYLRTADVRIGWEQRSA